MLLKNILWDYFGRFSLLFANLAVTAVLARILTPNDYGIIGIVLAINGMASIFLELGFSSAIIQQKEVNETQLSTIFTIGFLVALVIYAIIFLTAPYLASFYELPILTTLIRVSAISFIINAWNIVPNALIQKRMMFKEQSVRNITLTILIGLIAITMAYYGWGVWALVWQSLFNLLLLALVNIWLTGWRPRIKMDLVSIGPMFHYGKYLFFSGALNTVFSRLDALIIGKVLNTDTLGLYSRAKGMEKMVQGIATKSLNAVMFPYFSRFQDDDQQLLKSFDRFFHLICVLIFLFTGLAYLNATWVFYFLFGKQWTFSADYYRIIALSAFVYPLSSLALNIVSARGNSRHYFIAEVAKKLTLTPVFFLIYWSLEAFLYGMVLASVLFLLINFYVLSKSLAISVWAYWKKLSLYFLMVFPFLFLWEVLRQKLSGFDDTFLWATFTSLIFAGLFGLSLRWLQPLAYETFIAQARALWAKAFAQKET